MTPHPEHLEKNLRRACELVDYHARSGAAKLYGFSEFLLPALPAVNDLDVNETDCARIPGSERAELGAVARTWGVLVSPSAPVIAETSYD